LRAGETVLINGATGNSGRLAIQIAKHLGAGKVIATGRRLTDDLTALGADETLQLTDDRDSLEETFKEAFREGIDIVLDYLWGPSAETLIIGGGQGSPGRRGDPLRRDWFDEWAGDHASQRGASLERATAVPFAA
jgi:threonine dehydrogenase-like Zn-dependent dehydrogenase